MSSNDKHNISFKLGAVTPQQISRSFTVLRQDTGSTGSKIIKHRRQQSDSRTRNMTKQKINMMSDIDNDGNGPGKNFSMYNLRQLLITNIKTNKENRPLSKTAQSRAKKSHRKSTHSLNISKLNDSKTGLKYNNIKTKELMKHIKKANIRAKNGNEIATSPSMANLINTTGFDRTGRNDIVPLKQKEGGK